MSPLLVCVFAVSLKRVLTDLSSSQLECKSHIYAFFMHRLTPSQWALIELSRNSDMQTKLRNELLEHGADPTYDQLSNGLPYLDAVVHEIIRIHPPGGEITRVVRRRWLLTTVPSSSLSVYAALFHRQSKMMSSRSPHPFARNPAS